MTLVSNHVTGICIVRSDAHGPIVRRVATCVVVAGLGCVLWTVKGYLQVTSLITAMLRTIAAPKDKKKKRGQDDQAKVCG